mmetsp:Transcript_30825/g.77379  ORF Transcript_30825/g.77379 Transcript_30825/m.77379 type:complete len:234 (-) Transcript_30825:556-1257(-)
MTLSCCPTPLANDSTASLKSGWRSSSTKSCGSVRLSAASSREMSGPSSVVSTSNTFVVGRKGMPLLVCLGARTLRLEVARFRPGLEPISSALLTDREGAMALEIMDRRVRMSFSAALVVRSYGVRPSAVRAANACAPFASKSWATWYWLLSAHMCSGVPIFISECTLAPLSMSSCATLTWPPFAAKCSDVTTISRPGTASSSGAMVDTKAPLSRRISQTCMCPNRDAASRGVR